MPTISEIKENKEKEPIRYPAMMRGSHGLVVLFIQENEGTVVFTGASDYKLGQYNDKWSSTCFKLIEGENIVLRNT